MKILRLLAIFLVVVGLGACAGQQRLTPQQQAEAAIAHDPVEIAAFAKKVERTLAEKGVRVALVARVGRPVSQLPPGINYTHVGFWVYDPAIELDDGRVVAGYRTANLYQGAGDRSNVGATAEVFPAEFFADVHSLRAGVIIPTPEMQTRLQQVLTSSAYTDYVIPEYSVVANPYDRRFQNCTNYVLDVVVAAMHWEGLHDWFDDPGSHQVKWWIKAELETTFQAQRIHLSDSQVWLANNFMADFTDEDHYGRPIETSSFGTIKQYLEGVRRDGSYGPNHVLEVLTITR